jgi:hypothetical protein
MLSKFGFLICLAVLFSLKPLGVACQQKKSGGTTADEGSCLKETTIKVADGEQIITLRDAGQIKLIVEKYLAEKKPKPEASVSGPGKVFIDCQGTVRMGAWILESPFSGGRGLRLTLRILTNERFIVRQEIRVQQAEGRWEVVGINRVTYHRSGPR